MDRNKRDIDTRPSFSRKKAQLSGITKLFTIKDYEWMHEQKRIYTRCASVQEQAEAQFKKYIMDLDDKFSNSNIEHYLDNAKDIFPFFKSMHMPTLAAAYLLFHNLISQGLNITDYIIIQKLTLQYATIIMSKSKDTSSPDLIEKHQIDVIRYLHAILIQHNLLDKEKASS